MGKGWAACGGDQGGWDGGKGNGITEVRRKKKGRKGGRGARGILIYWRDLGEELCPGVPLRRGRESVYSGTRKNF